jgi:RNA polymerase sigma-70 factor (ECF subfamily)
MPALDPAIPRPRAAVLEAFRAREPGSVGHLYQEYGGAVYAVAYRVLGRDDLAEAATRQTFARAWQAADRMDPDRVAEWLVTLAKVSALELSHEHAVAHTDADLDTLDAVWRVRRTIDELQPEQAIIVRLQHVEGLSLPEIAARLDVPLGVVRARAERAHQKLGSLLGNLRTG